MKPELALLRGIPVTLLLWAASQAIGIVLAAPVAAARMHTRRWLRLPAMVWIEVLRGIPTLVWLFLVFFGLVALGYSFTAIVSAIITLGLVTSAHLAEIYRAGFEGIPKQQVEATMVLGLPLIVRFRKVFLPQAFPIIVEGGGSYSIHLFKDTALASLIGVVDIMSIATYQVERGANGPVIFLVTGAIYLVFCLAIAWIAHVLAKLFVPGRAKAGPGKLRVAA